MHIVEEVGVMMTLAAYMELGVPHSYAFAFLEGAHMAEVPLIPASDLALVWKNGVAVEYARAGAIAQVTTPSIIAMWLSSVPADYMTASA